MMCAPDSATMVWKRFSDGLPGTVLGPGAAATAGGLPGIGLNGDANEAARCDSSRSAVVHAVVVVVVVQNTSESSTHVHNSNNYYGVLCLFIDLSWDCS